MINKICHFEIGARDYAKLKDFYANVFAWRFEKGGGGEEMIRTGDDVGGHLHQRPKPPNYVVVYVMVDDIPATIAKAESRGGKVVLGPMPEGKTGTYAWIADPEGNVIGVYSEKKK